MMQLVPVAVGHSLDDAKFQAYAEENYFLADEEDNNDRLDNNNDGYFSDGTLPMEERDEVDDDCFFNNILEDLSENDLNKNPIGTEGNAKSVGELVSSEYDGDDVVPGDPCPPDMGLSDGEDFLAAKVLDISAFVLPVPNGEDFLAAKARPVSNCVEVNTPICDWAEYCVLVNTAVCDWAECRLCTPGLPQQPCEKEGAKCNRFAHHLCVCQWEEINQLPEHDIANLCIAHHPVYFAEQEPATKQLATETFA
jgi:hypothetical protein